MTAFTTQIRALIADEAGASMVEEALILAVMVCAVMWGVINVTNTLQGGIFGAASAIGDSIPAS
jgi:Flp pilus assembly pilin Flp